MDGVRFAVSGEAWWDAYAPIHTATSSDRSDPPDALTGKVLAPTWCRKGRLMIAKCTEAQAIRRGWPDALSGIYGQEELHALLLSQRTACEKTTPEPSPLSSSGDHRGLWFVFDQGLHSYRYDWVRRFTLCAIATSVRTRWPTLSGLITSTS